LSKSLYEHCIECNDDSLLREWHPVLNGSLTPKDVLAGTHKKTWWRCERGHEWHAQVRSRVSGCQCPICTNREVFVGENDLSTTHPELAMQWHAAKNGHITPQCVTFGSAVKAWWICERGHEWQARVNSRASGNTGCPVCSGNIVDTGMNDLSSIFPEISSQWHPTKNGTLQPDEVSSFSNRRVWWVCEKGHEWQTDISSRVRRFTGCPYCVGRKVLAGFNDLATLAPDVAEQWHPELNESLTPEQVTRSSHKKVWWQCPEGHVWKAVIHSRTGAARCGCPVCAGKVRKDRLIRYASLMDDKG